MMCSLRMGFPSTAATSWLTFAAALLPLKTIDSVSESHSAITSVVLSMTMLISDGTKSTANWKYSKAALSNASLAVTSSAMPILEARRVRFNWRAVTRDAT